MSTLTAAEITYIRAMSGDDCTPYEVSDEFMQYLHDEKASQAPLCMSGDSLGGTVVWVLRARLRKAVKLFNETGADGISKTVSQKYDHLKEQLADAEEQCGMAGGTITISTLDLGIDVDSDGTQYTSLYAYWSWGGYL